MEARAAYREPGISKKSVWFVFALLAALILAGTGAYVLKATSAPSAAAATHQVVLGQYAGGEGSAWNYSNRRSGTQSLEDPAPVAESAAAPVLRTAGRGGNQILP